MLWTQRPARYMQPPWVWQSRHLLLRECGLHTEIMWAQGSAPCAGLHRDERAGLARAAIQRTTAQIPASSWSSGCPPGRWPFSHLKGTGALHRLVRTAVSEGATDHSFRSSTPMMATCGAAAYRRLQRTGARACANQEPRKSPLEMSQAWVQGSATATSTKILLARKLGRAHLHLSRP